MCNKKNINSTQSTQSTPTPAHDSTNEPVSLKISDVSQTIFTTSSNNVLLQQEQQEQQEVSLHVQPHKEVNLEKIQNSKNNIKFNLENQDDIDDDSGDDDHDDNGDNENDAGKDHDNKLVKNKDDKNKTNETKDVAKNDNKNMNTHLSKHNLVNDTQIKNNENNLEKVESLELTELTDADLEIKTDDNIKLKKPNDIYYEIYNVAKEKARTARKLAFDAYLEVKKIKKTYMLDDSDSDFSNSSNSDSDSDEESD